MIYLSQKKQAGLIRDIRDGILKGSELALKYKIAMSTVTRYKYLLKHHKTMPGTGPRAINAKSPMTTAIVVHNGKKGAKWGRYQAQIYALRGQGFSRSEIAVRLNIPHYMANYYAMKYKKQHESQIQQVNSPNQKGALVENGINKNILLGVAWAETERFTALLAERLTLDPSLLRSRLPELLGRSPFRR
jgi:hypothetical protein